MLSTSIDAQSCPALAVLLFEACEAELFNIRYGGGGLSAICQQTQRKLLKV